MSDAPHDPHPQPSHAEVQAGAHEGPIRTPKQLLTAIFFGFALPVALIVLLVVYVTSAPRPAAGADAFTAQAIAHRLQPVGSVLVKDASDLSTLKTGEQVFAGQCTTCHTAGLVGAPKFGDTAAWAPRIATGYPALLNSALHGKGNMGPQGGGDYADLEIGRAVVYMANKAGATFADPKAPTPGAAEASAASVATAASAGEASAAPATGAATMNPSPAASAAAERLAMAAPAAPAAPVVAAAPAGAEAPSAVAPPLFAQICQACHIAGVAGAPKLGDKAAWGPRIAAAHGIDGLTASAIKGKGAMPPRGGSAATDAEIRTVVAYMVNAAK